MPDDTSSSKSPETVSAGGERGEAPGGAAGDPDQTGDRSDRSITDFVRRAVSAGVGAAARSKDDLMRAAATEVRTWLEHLNLDDEIARVLAKMVIEVKTEIRFRTTEDGKLVPESTNDFRVKGSR